MANEHQYNFAIYISLRVGSILLAVGVILIASITAYYSATGVIFNPVFHIPAWFLNNLMDRVFLPISTTDFSRLYAIHDFLSTGDTIIGALYLLAAFAITFYLVMFAGLYITGFISDYSIKYKLGAEGAAAYNKEQQEKLKIKREEDKSLSDLEKAQREHYVQWKKTFKSELSYDEWKSMFLGE